MGIWRVVFMGGEMSWRKEMDEGIGEEVGRIRGESVIIIFGLVIRKKGIEVM